MLACLIDCDKENLAGLQFLLGLSDKQLFAILTNRPSCKGSVVRGVLWEISMKNTLDTLWKTTNTDMERKTYIAQ